MANPKMPVESGGGGLLDGLRAKKSAKPNGGSGFIMTESQDRDARSGRTPSGFVRVSKDAFATLDKIAVYETTKSPAMGTSPDGPWYRRLLWAIPVSRNTDAK